MTDISESGIEAAMKAFALIAHDLSPEQYDESRAAATYPAATKALKKSIDAMSAAIQAYLPFHPPASREEGLIDALTKVRDAILSPINSLAIVDTVWMPVPGAAYSIETLVDFIDAQTALIPTKPEAKEAHWAARNEPDYADPARPPGAYATESKKPE